MEENAAGKISRRSRPNPAAPRRTRRPAPVWSPGERRAALLTAAAPGPPDAHVILLHDIIFLIELPGDGGEDNVTKEGKTKWTDSLSQVSPRGKRHLTLTPGSRSIRKCPPRVSMRPVGAITTEPGFYKRETQRRRRRSDVTVRKSRGSVQGPRCAQSERDHGRRPRSCLPLSRWRDAKPRSSGATPRGAEL